MGGKRLLELNPGDKEKLESIAKSSILSTRTTNRAKAILLKSKGLTYDEIADKLDISSGTVALCINKYKEGGLEDALNDRKGRGAKPKYSDEEKTYVINLACAKPRLLGRPADRWTYTELTKYIHKSAAEMGYPRLANISRSMVRTILENAEIKPFRVTYYCERRDPEFDEKMHTILIVYKQMELQFNDDTEHLPYDPETTHTLSYDEKPGIQALSTTGEDRSPMIGNGTIQRDYEYKRLGTMSLLCGIDLETGTAFPLMRDSHKSSDFTDFLDRLDTYYPKGHVIRLILDNHIIHKSKETNRYLDAHPGRFSFVFTPKHGSWLNMIEGFFSKMTKQLLKGMRVNSKEELVSRVYQYIDELNEDPKPFRWTYKMDEIGFKDTMKLSLPLLPVKDI